MVRTLTCTVLGFVLCAGVALAAKNNQMVKGTVKSVDTEKNVLVVSQKVKDESVDRELEILDTTEVTVESSAGTQTATGKAGLELLKGTEGASVKVKCDKDVQVLSVSVKVNK